MEVLIVLLRILCQLLQQGQRAFHVLIQISLISQRITIHHNQTLLQSQAAVKLSTTSLLVLGQEHAIVPDQFQVSPPGFHVLGLDLNLGGQELKVKQSPIREADLERLPVRRIVDHVDEGDDLAEGLRKLSLSVGSLFLEPVSCRSRTFTSSISSSESRSSR
jgi:hypothetical protein